MKEEHKIKVRRARAKVNEPVQQELDSHETFHRLRSPSDRDSAYAELAPIAPTPPKQGGRRGKLTAQQKYDRWMVRLAANPAKAKAYYLRHKEAIDSVRTAKPSEVYENTPVDHAEGVNLMAQYEHAMTTWRNKCAHHRCLMLKMTGMMKRERFSVKRLRAFCAKHPDVFDGLSPRPMPVQPEIPEEAHTTAPKLDGRTGIRKQVAAKTKALTSIDERMAEEQRKAKAAKKEEPRPVMRHHTESNPWLHAKHARNK